MAKKYIKKKDGPNKAGPKYRTPDHFKGSKFSGGGKGRESRPKFNPGQFRVQHKG